MKYPNSGVMFSRVAEGKQPNLTGKIDLGEDLIDYINQEHRAGKDVSIDISGWTKLAPDGKKYISLSVKKAWKAPAKTVDEDVPF